MSQSEFKKRLKALMNKKENQICSDCPERQPRWASLIVPPPGSPPGSLAFGALTCLECSGSHRRLGVHIAFVRSITLDSWKEKEVLAMENGGNDKVNAIFEANLHNYATKPTTSANGSVRERFIRDKYERRKYYDPSVMQNYAEGSDDSSSEDEDPRVRTKPATRAPSEVARMRALARKQQQRQVKKPMSSSSASNNRRIQRASAPVPVAAAAPEVDLLDFCLPISDPGPPPNPPSAAPSPTLDMFKNMKMGDLSGANTMGTMSMSMPMSNTRKGDINARTSQQSDDLFSAFQSPSQPQQQHPQQQHPQQQYPQQQQHPQQQQRTNNGFGNMNTMSGAYTNNGVNPMGNMNGMNMNNMNMNNMNVNNMGMNMNMNDRNNRNMNNIGMNMNTNNMKTNMNNMGGMNMNNNNMGMMMNRNQNQFGGGNNAMMNNNSMNIRMSMNSGNNAGMGNMKNNNMMGMNNNNAMNMNMQQNMQQNMMADLQHQNNNTMGGGMGMNMNQNMNNFGMGNSNNSNNNNNSMNAMGGTSSNMNGMSGTPSNMNSMGMGGQSGSGNGFDGVMGGAANTSANQFASFGSFR